MISVMTRKMYTWAYVYICVCEVHVKQIVTISESSKFHNLQMLSDSFLACKGEPDSSDLALLVQELFIMTKNHI